MAPPARRQNYIPRAMLPSQGSGRRRDAVATRERLVRAALELFTVQDYGVTTTVDIAAKAGTAEATIYRHFPGKEALFNEAYREALRAGLAALRLVDGERGLGTEDRLQRLGRRLVERAAQDPAVVLMLLRRGAPKVLDEPSLALTREFREGIAQIIAGGKQEGAIRAGSAELWSAVWLVLVSFVVDRVTSRDWSLDHPSVAQTLDAAWAAIANRPDRSASP